MPPFTKPMLFLLFICTACSNATTVEKPINPASVVEDYENLKEEEQLTESQDRILRLLKTFAQGQDTMAKILPPAATVSREDFLKTSERVGAKPPRSAPMIL